MRIVWPVLGLFAFVGCTGGPAHSPSESIGTPVPGPSSASPAAPADPSPSASLTWVTLPAGTTTDCASGAGYTITGAGEFQLTGECELVSIAGDRAEVTGGGRIVRLSIQGQGNEVETGAVGQIKIAGDRNEVTAREVTGVQVAGQANEVDASTIDAVVLNGDRNEVDGGTRIGSLTINGNDNEVEAQQIVERDVVGTRNRVTER